MGMGAGGLRKFFRRRRRRRRRRPGEGGRREGEGFQCFPLHWRHTGNLREEQWNLREEQWNPREDNGTYVKRWNLSEEMEPK